MINWNFKILSVCETYNGNMRIRHAVKKVDNIEGNKDSEQFLK